MNKAAIMPEYELFTTAWELVKAYHDYGPTAPESRTQQLLTDLEPPADPATKYPCAGPVKGSGGLFHSQGPIKKGSGAQHSRLFLLIGGVPLHRFINSYLYTSPRFPMVSTRTISTSFSSA